MPYRRPRLMATISSPSFDMPYAFCGLEIRSGVACISSGPPHTGQGMSHWPAASALLRAHARHLLAVDRAPVEPFAHRRLRRRHHDPGEVEALGHDDLVEQGGRDHVHVGEPREVGQVVLVGGEVVDGVDAAQEVGEQVAVAGVALVEVDPGTQVRRAARSGVPAGSARRARRPRARAPAAGRRCAIR